jgi:hypothetical protein
MLSDSIVPATLPPANCRNLRRLTARINITYLTSTGNAQAATLASSNTHTLTDGQHPQQHF